MEYRKVKERGGNGKMALRDLERYNECFTVHNLELSPE